MERIDWFTKLLGAATFLIAVTAVIGATLLFSPGIGDRTERTVTITSVVDGDTVETRDGERIRLLGVDAAEPGETCHDTARNTLNRSVTGKPVVLDAAGHGRDRYDRLLRYLYVNGTNVNLALVKEGVAKARISPDLSTYREEFITAEEAARRHGKGCAWHQEEAVAATVAACDASQYQGETVNVTGKVVDTHVDTDTRTVFLNFEHSYPGQCFTAVIFGSARHRFPEDPAEYYKGETVTVTGTVETYQDRVETVLTSGDDITVHGP